MAGERTALVLGATGLVGGVLLRRLLDDPAWTHVTVLGRRPTGRVHPRLTEVAAELDEIPDHAERFAVHTVFCCLGTTLRKAGSREAFRRVDLGAVAIAARLASRGGATRFLLVSAGGADPASRIFYNRVKGEAEAAVLAAGIPGVDVFRPSLILGPRGERRPLEAAAQRIGRLLAPLLAGPLRRVRPVPADAVARAMLRLASDAAPGRRTVENEEILSLAGSPGDA
jgi:uncharacterized protein YbjT (DUF2867 family)